MVRSPILGPVSPRVSRPERALLEGRLCDLGLTLAGSRFAPLLVRLRGELIGMGIRLAPIFYLSTEYGCIERTATIGLLFTDGFSVPQRLAKKHGIRVRTPRQVLPTLRHEVGHAFCYVHGLYRETRFRRLFGVRGGFFQSYPDVWKPRLADYRRLERGELIFLYAARHADEDFAISFQVWLESEAEGRFSWRRKFADRPKILEKLAYVEEVVEQHGPRVPRHPKPAFDEPIARLDLTFGEWIKSVRAGNNYNLFAESPVALGERARAQVR